MVAPLWFLPVVFGWCSLRTHSLLASQLPHIVVLITKALAFQLSLSTPSPPSGHHHHPHTSPPTILDHPRPVTDAVVVINRNFIPFYTPVRKAVSPSLLKRGNRTDRYICSLADGNSGVLILNLRPLPVPVCAHKLTPGSLSLFFILYF